MDIKELLDESTKHGCDISISAVHNGQTLNLRLRKDGYTFDRCIDSAMLTCAHIDVVGQAFKHMITDIEKASAE